MPDIAVIVPVYKAEAFLSRCVDSILSQTFSHLRLILVDDGSPDRCPEICDGYAAADERVHVIHQKNSGPSAARNHGIDYVMENTDCSHLVFVDSDDCVHPDFLRLLSAAVRGTGAKAAMCGHQYIGPLDSPELPEVSTTPVLQVMDTETLMVTRSDGFNYPWGKLFPRACFETLRYPEDVSFGEDNLIIYKALFDCGTVAYLEDKLYLYFFNAEGITKTPWSERSLQVFLGIEAQIEFYRAKGFDRALRKETELYIQQCAYQIHRIRENPEVLRKNLHHLKALKANMRDMLRRNRDFRLRDHFYWFEALHPGVAAMRSAVHRLRTNLQKEGLVGTLRKILRR